MGGGDHTAGLVSQQHRCAIGGEDTERKTATARDHRVGDRRAVPGPRIVHMHDVGGMALLHGHQGRRAKLVEAPRACRCHLRGFLRRAIGAIRAAMGLAGGAVACEKSVAHTRRGGKRGNANDSVQDRRRSWRCILRETLEPRQGIGKARMNHRHGFEQ